MFLQKKLRKEYEVFIMNRKIGVILSYVLMAFEILSTLLITPFIIKTLGQAEYGVYKLVIAINAYLMLLDLGVGNAIVRYIAKFRAQKDSQQERKFFGITIIYYLAIAIITLIFGSILVSIFPHVFAKGLSSVEIAIGKKLLAIMMVTSAITLGTTVYSNILIGYEKFAVTKSCSIVQIIIKIILTYLALSKGMGSIGVVYVNLFVTIIGKSYCVGYVLWKIRLRPLFKGIDLSFVKEIVAYSSLILLQMIATQLNSTVDQVVLGMYVSSSAVLIGIYGVGTQIVQYFQSIGTVFTGVLMPGIVQLVENKPTPQKLNEEMIRIGRLIFMVLAMIWSCFLVAGERFIILWAGRSNKEAYYVAILLMFAYVWVLTESVGSQILWAANEHKEQSILKLMIVLMNIFLTIILIKWEPLLGATIGTVLSLMIGDIGVMNLIFHKKLRIDLIYYYKGITKGILPSIVISALIGFGLKNLLATNWSHFFIIVSVMVAAYGISMLLFGFNQYEKSLVYSMYRTIKNRMFK